MASSPVIELHNLTVTYESKPALWNVDYELPGQEIVGVIGPNGSGKSTMIKAIMGLVDTASGHVEVFDQHIDQVRQRVAYVPQRSSVDWDFPVNVFDAVLMGRIRPGNVFRRYSARDRQIALACIDKVNLRPYVNRQIAQLSGGQQQRVFIARALAQEADLYLLDEPFAGVDIATETAIVALLKEMKQEGKTILVVHHDLQTVTQYFDWLIMLNTRLVAIGPTAKVFNTQNLNDTYGGKLDILSQVAELMKDKAHPVREK